MMMRKMRSLWMGVAVVAALPVTSALAAVAQSNTVTITGGYNKTVQSQQWQQTGTTWQSYTYQATVTTYQTKQVQTGTMTQTVETGTKQVQTGTEQVCRGGLVGGWTGPHHTIWTNHCVGSIVTEPVYTTEAVYRSQTVPVYTTETVPVTRVETLIGYRSEPVYGWAAVNTQQWVPVFIQGAVS